MLAKEDVLSTYNVNVLGKGSRTLLFAHGLGCDQNVWKHVVAAFAEDYKIILFDYIGSGHTDVSRYSKERHSSLNGYAEDILDICTALELNDITFVGHSVSSMIGLLVAIKEPSLFSRLIMIGPSPCYFNEPPYYGGFDREHLEELLLMMQKNYMEWSGFFAPKVMGNAGRPELAGALKDLFCKADPRITCDFARVTFLSDNRGDLHQLRVPSLILQPAEDIVAPTVVGEYLHQRLPKSTLFYMEATGHFPHLSAVEETVSLIRQYLDGIDA
jgi:sigma-B regulation protein RsbQ